MGGLSTGSSIPTPERGGDSSDLPTPTTSSTAGDMYPASGGYVSPSPNSNSFLSGSVGFGGDNNPDDVLKVSSALKNNGQLKNFDVGSKAHSDINNGIMNLQRDMGGLKIDGLVKPGGPTERAFTQNVHKNTLKAPSEQALKAQATRDRTDPNLPNPGNLTAEENSKRNAKANKQSLERTRQQNIDAQKAHQDAMKAQAKIQELENKRLERSMKQLYGQPAKAPSTANRGALESAKQKQTHMQKSLAKLLTTAIQQSKAKRQQANEETPSSTGLTRGSLESAKPKLPKVSGEAFSANARTVEALKKTTELGDYPFYVADALKEHGPKAEAEVRDLMEQMHDAMPEHAKNMAKGVYSYLTPEERQRFAHVFDIEGGSLSAGTDNGDGTKDLSEQELKNLSVTPPDDTEGEEPLSISVDDPWPSLVPSPIEQSKPPTGESASAQEKAFLAKMDKHLRGVLGPAYGQLIGMGEVLAEFSPGEDVKDIKEGSALISEGTKNMDLDKVTAGAAQLVGSLASLGLPGNYSAIKEGTTHVTQKGKELLQPTVSKAPARTPEQVEKFRAKLDGEIKTSWSGAVKVDAKNTNEQAAKTWRDRRIKTQGWIAGLSGKYHRAYDENAPTYNLETPKGGQTFVRVVPKGAEGKPAGVWLMRKEDFLDITSQPNAPEILKDRFALPEVPTAWTEVKLPQGVKLRAGIANGHPKWGAGGEIQFQLEQFPDLDWFSPTKPLTGEIK